MSPLRRGEGLRASVGLGCDRRVVHHGRMTRRVLGSVCLAALMACSAEEEIGEVTGGNGEVSLPSVPTPPTTDTNGTAC